MKVWESYVCVLYCNSPPVVALAVVAAVGIESAPAKEAPADEAPAMPVAAPLRLGHRQGQDQGQGQHECDLGFGDKECDAWVAMIMCKNHLNNNDNNNNSSSSSDRNYVNTHTTFMLIFLGKCAGNSATVCLVSSSGGAPFIASRASLPPSLLPLHHPLTGFLLLPFQRTWRPEKFNGVADALVLVQRLGEGGGRRGGGGRGGGGRGRGRGGGGGGGGV